MSKHIPPKKLWLMRYYVDIRHPRVTLGQLIPDSPEPSSSSRLFSRTSSIETITSSSSDDSDYFINKRPQNIKKPKIKSLDAINRSIKKQNKIK